MRIGCVSESDDGRRAELPAPVGVEEAFDALGAQHLPQRGDGPSRGEDVVVEALAVAAVVPGGVLHHFGVVAHAADVEVGGFGGHELQHRAADDGAHAREVLVAAFGAEPVEDGGELEDEDVDVVVLDRDVAPAPRTESHVAEHLSPCEGNIPQVVPREGEIGGFAAQLDVAAALLAVGTHRQIVHGRRGVECGLLVFAVGVECRGEVVGAGDDVLLDVVGRTAGGLAEILVAEVGGGHRQRQGGRGGAASRGVDQTQVVAELARKAAVGVLQLQQPVEQRVDPLLPLLVASSLLLFIGQVEQQGVGPFRLAADAVDVGFAVALEVDHLADQSAGREAVPKVAVKDRAGILHEGFVVGGLAVFEGVAGVQQHASDESHLGHAVAGGVVCTQFDARGVFERVVAHVALQEVFAQQRLGLVGGVGRVERLRVEAVEGVVPDVGHEPGVGVAVSLTDYPRQPAAFALLQHFEAADLRGEVQFADVGFRGLAPGESEDEGSPAVDVAESGEAQRRAAREDHFAVVVAGERLLAERIGAQYGEKVARVFVVDTRERRAETVFAHLPAVRGVERRRRFGRTQIAVVPEARHVEETLLVGKRRAVELLHIIIDPFGGGQRERKPGFGALGDGLAADVDRQCAIGLEALGIVGRDVEFVGESRVSGIFEQDASRQGLIGSVGVCANTPAQGCGDKQNCEPVLHVE